MNLESNQKSPEFKAKNQDNKEISLSDFKNKIVVLYFYPKDMTKGCTIEANEFSGLIDEFDKNGAVIIGVSPDSCASHKKFIQKEGLKHILISDEDKNIAQKYGVWVEKSMYGRKYMGILRSTFVIKNGKIAHALYNVKSSGHAKKVLELIQNL